MKKIFIFLVAVAALFSACNDYETYGDMKEKERNAISKFIADSSITVISEDQFVKQGKTTDLTRNEFVRLDKTGVYMQIVDKGCGEQIKNGESVNVCCRFTEYNMLDDTKTNFNTTSSTAISLDVMRVTCTSGTYSAYFTKGMMSSYYGSSVPSGWLTALKYVNIGTPKSDSDELTKVRLIVPHSQGHATASTNVTPYYYVIFFQREA